MDTDGLVRFSRAGDAFHYRWAARRCLHMISPNSSISMITIEGSVSRKLAGEYVIDVAEYYEERSKVIYYQLKHTTKRLDQPIQLSDLKGTIQGFSDRFKAHKGDQLDEIKGFELITNRPVCKTFKDNCKAVVLGKEIPKRFLTTLKKYTGLSSKRLSKFCSLLVLNDGEGNYLDQRLTLQGELSELVAGVVDNPKIDTLIEMVAGKALPDNEGEITREAVLQRLGVPSVKLMFPAPPKFEELNNPIKRRQQDELLELIVTADQPVIIHAEGGVGKSVICKQLADSLPNGWKHVIYDCFGAGQYRSRSHPRHRYRDVVAQISNEFAESGLCEPLIPGDSDLEDALLRVLNSRILKSIESIRKKTNLANLVIFIDAADNAEMAAKEFSESCFASQFINEDFPEGCKVVALCRTERISWLNPKSSVKQKLLEPFDQEETRLHAEQYYTGIFEDDAKELYRLTNGNPRVQANALSVQDGDIADVLESLGPSPTTVDDQINGQLQNAMDRLKDALPLDEQHDIESLCYGLANLPPFIPLNVLALAANVHESLIKSFVSDLGRPLWLSDSSVMFRDEPTESWFINQFSTSPERIQSYIEKIKPLANKTQYIAETLPALLLKAESYSELIELSLSDDYLPENPIDARNANLHRLQFAFKAALKKQRLGDASKLAMLAGEEVSSDNRQFDLLRENVDLLGRLQSPQRAQDLAYKQELRGGWQGSENIYSASLLSTIEDCKGEARAYLRAASNWLRIFFEQREKEGDQPDLGNLEDQEIAEIVSTRYRLFGAKKVSEYVFQWKPSKAILSITPRFFSRLVDIQTYDEIESIISNAKRDDVVRYQYLCLSATHELWRVNRTLKTANLRRCLDSFLDSGKADQKSLQQETLLGAICFAEACAHRRISKKKIRKFLKHHVLKEATYSVYDEHRSDARSGYLKCIALDHILSRRENVSIEKLLPSNLQKKDGNSNSGDAEKFKQLIGGLLPWYQIRAKVIIGIPIDINDAYEKANKRSNAATSRRYSSYDTLPSEISKVKFDIFSFNNVEITRKNIFDILSADSIKFRLNDRIEALRVSSRLEPLECILDTLESSCYDSIVSYTEGSPEDTSSELVRLSRAVLPTSPPDAQAYFDLALDSVSKFGHEITERWYATAAIAKKYSETESENKEIAYRFIRCTELVGNYVAREKYIDRSSAVNICASISQTTAVAALSRWRDRDVGWFEKQLVSLLNVLARNSLITANLAWSLDAFRLNIDGIDLIICCIDNAKEKHEKQRMLDTAVRELLLKESNVSKFQELNVICEKYQLVNHQLVDAISYLEKVEKPSYEEDRSVRQFRTSPSSSYNYQELFEGLELASPEGINAAIRKFDSIEGGRSPEEFWKQYYISLDAGSASIFLKNIVQAEEADSYDVEKAIENMPTISRNKVSVKQVLPSVVTKLVRRFATDYANQYAMERLEKILDDSSLVQNIQSGMLEGLSESPHFYDAQTLFSFAQFAANHISISDAYETLEIALSRFERHIDDDFGDGNWAEWLDTNDSTALAFVGLIWSALGSPKSSTRWAAALNVRRLVEMGCFAEIDALIDRMQIGTVVSYGCRSFEFYELHAKLYLLIGLSRAAVEDTRNLVKHRKIFLDLALDCSHVLINYFAAKIALSIELHSPESHSEEEIRNLMLVNRSEYSAMSIDNRYQSSLVSPWHESGDVDTEIDFYLSYDFDRYWYEPLGRVFGITSSQVQDLAKEVVKTFVDSYTGRYLDDARKELFEYSYEYKNTSHSHGDYPEIDDTAFYASYHAMFVVAKKLLREMPVVNGPYEDDDSWFDWLSRHTLSLSDGNWLSDRRDVPPLEKRVWLSVDQGENWRWEITKDDFISGLVRCRDYEVWLNLYGGWNECNSTRNESYRICSAFVDEDTSSALLVALSTCNNPHDYKLPSYEEDGMEIKTSSFNLTGWINDYDVEKRLDRFDHYAGDFYFPPLSVGESVVKALELRSDSEERYWYEVENIDPVICSLCWGTKPERESDKYSRRGQRVSVSLEFIKAALKKLKKDLVIEVQINRSENNYHSNKEDDEIKYAPAYSNVFILRKNGELRDATASYELGKETC